VQRLKAALTERAPKTVNNVLTVLSVVLRTAVEWGVIARVPCSVKLLKAPKNEASFHDFDEYERLVEAARSEPQTYLAVLLGGEAGMRCGEIMALEWSGADLSNRHFSSIRHHAKCFLAKARPDPVLRYFSNRAAVGASANWIETRTRHGRCLAA
jgi:integrase